MDWLDQKLGNYCKTIQEQIDENPFLSYPMKQKFVEMLEDCAKEAKQEEGDTTALFNRKLNRLSNEFEVLTHGSKIEIQKFV